MSKNSGESVTATERLNADDCSDRVVFILPQLPPAHCGLGDYSMILLTEMHLDPPPRILVRHGAAATRVAHPELDVEQLPGTQDGLVVRLRELRAKRVFVQYVAQGFQSRGCPLWFLAALRNWRRETPDRRLVIMFQELWFDPPWWKPDWLLQKCHRAALRRLVNVVDRVFVSTATFVRLLSGATSPEKIRLLINPATICPQELVAKPSREDGFWVLFGLQGSRLLALEGMAPWLPTLHRKGIIKRLGVVGARGKQAANDREDALLASALPEEAVDLHGALPAESVSSLLQQAEVGLFAKVSHGYTKSTIFMAYASHGVCIVSPEHVGDYEPPLCWVTHPSEFSKGRSIEDVIRRGNSLQQWYSDNASWEHVASIYKEALSVV